jgi:hypothetical protein
MLYYERPSQYQNINTNLTTYVGLIPFNKIFFLFVNKNSLIHVNVILKVELNIHFMYYFVYIIAHREISGITIAFTNGRAG